MKYIKRFMPLVVLLVLLVTCLVFPVNAEESASDFRFSFIDYFGKGAMFSVSPGESVSWYSLFNPGGVFYEGTDYIMKTEGNRVYFVFDRDGNGVSEKYPFVYNSLQGLTFVNQDSQVLSVSYDVLLPYYSGGYTTEDLLKVFDHYILECELNFSLDGQIVSLRYPSNIRFWQDLVSVAPPANDLLGEFRFEVSDRYVYLIRNLPSGSSEKYILLNSTNVPIFSTDNIFHGNSAESLLITLVPVCEDGLHSFTQQILTEATCVTPGTKVLSCIKCSYVTEVVVSAVGHDFHNLIEEHPAKCPELGYKIVQCSRCRELKKVVLPLEHNYTAVTCTKDSYCIGCGQITALADGHDYSWGKCTRCGDLWIVPGDQDDQFGGGFLDGVGGFIGNVGTTLEDGLNNVVDSITGGGADNGGGGNTDDGAGGGDGEESNWFLDWLGLSDLGKKIGSFFKTILAIGGICLVIGFWPKISKFFKWVGKGFSAIWKSIKKFFKSLAKKRKKK